MGTPDRIGLLLGTLVQPPGGKPGGFGAHPNDPYPLLGPMMQLLTPTL